jgi:hypothetical protein
MLLLDQSFWLLVVLASLNLGVLAFLIARGRRLQQRCGPATAHERGDRIDAPTEAPPCEKLR